MADVMQAYAMPIDEFPGDAVDMRLVDGTDATKKLNIVAAGDAILAAKGLVLFGLDTSNNAKQLSLDAGGNLKVTGGGGGFEVLDGQLAVLASDLGGIFAGFDGTNYQFIKTDAAGELQVDILTLPSIPQLPAALVGGRLDVNIGNIPSVAQSGTWNIGTLASITNPVAVTGTFWQATQPVSVASLPLPTGAATSANQTTEITSLQLLDDLPHLDVDSITGAKGVGIMGSDGTNLRWLKIDSTGALAVQTQPSPNVYFIVGQITSASTAIKTVEKTTYTEQTTNGQRSIASASANDTAAGTGARTVKITYYNSTGSGPYEETLTLNGTTGVNTVATNICFIEKMEVLTVGSTLSNVGIISLYTAINKGGTVFGSIAATDNRTFWAHHYVPVGKTMKVTGISVSHDGTVAGSGAAFILSAKLINVADVPEIQISDFVRLYGQSSTISRLYNSPVKVTGPARVMMYVTPEAGSSIIYRGAVDFYEE